MSPTRRTLAAAAAAFTIPALLVSFRVAAEDGPPEANRPPPFDAEPFPEEKSPPPKKAEWQAAPRVTLDPKMLGERPCEARRVREWVRLRCDSADFGAIRLLGGKRDGMQTVLDKPSPDFEGVAGAAELVIPIRRGDARVVEVMTIELGYKGSSSVSPWMVLSESWPPEDERPTIAIQ